MYPPNSIAIIILSAILYHPYRSQMFSFDVMNMENVQILYKALGRSAKSPGQCIISASIPLLDGNQKDMIRKIEFTRQTNSSELQESMIENFPKLERIILSGNNITKIQTGTFFNLPHLKYVYLGDNSISRMEVNIFISTPQLNEIHLQKNEMIDFEQVWLGYIPTLRRLNLQYNLLRRLRVGAFSNFPNLLYIDLGNNQIRHIHEDAFYGLDYLEILDLSYNEIKMLHKDTFISPSSLHVLNLYHNQLTYISNETLSKLTQLRELITLFNPLQCGCYKMMELWAEMKSVRLNKDEYLKCEKETDISEIPKSVCFESHDVCSDNATLLSQHDTFYSEEKDFICRFEYEKYIDVK